MRIHLRMVTLEHSITLWNIPSVSLECAYWGKKTEYFILQTLAATRIEPKWVFFFNFTRAFSRSEVIDPYYFLFQSWTLPENLYPVFEKYSMYFHIFFFCYLIISGWSDTPWYLAGSLTIPIEENSKLGRLASISKCGHSGQRLFSLLNSLVLSIGLSMA